MIASCKKRTRNIEGDQNRMDEARKYVSREEEIVEGQEHQGRC